MEKKIVNSLENLTIDQTERLLDENMEMKIGGKDRNRIKNSVFEKIGSNKKKRIYIPKKLAACVVAFAIIFTSLSIVGFHNVAAAISKLFTFIPGIGITEKSDATIYTIDPIVRQTKSQSAKANVVRAVYTNDYLTVTVEVDGKAVHYDDFSFYINQELTNYREEPLSVLSVASDSTMLNFSHKTEAPKSDDIYEIAVTGFSERLSFKMTSCRDYDDIVRSGPADVQNGISITATANRIDNQLLVWCYPFKTANTTKDTIVGYGIPANAAFNKEKYIETESGRILDKRAGWHIQERFIFDMPDSDQTATLHIPYLSMLRNEKNKLSVNLPKDYATMESNVSIKCSLGTIKVTEVKRTPNEYEQDKDTVWLKFEFDSNDSNAALNSFEFETAGKYLSNAKHFNGENGCLEYLEVCVGKNENKISLNITNLYYYLLGEYVIPLDIQ